MILNPARLFSGVLAGNATIPVASATHVGHTLVGHSPNIAVFTGRVKPRNGLTRYVQHLRLRIAEHTSLCVETARESLYWLRLLTESALVTKAHLNPLMQETEELIAVITSIIVSTKRNRRR